MRAQDFDRAIGVYAIRPAAVRDVLFLFRKLPQLSLKIVDGDRKRPGDVAGGILVRRPRIENDDLVRSRALQYLVHVHELSMGAIAEMLADEAFQIGELMFGDGPDG